MAKRYEVSANGFEILSYCTFRTNNKNLIRTKLAFKIKGIYNLDAYKFLSISLFHSYNGNILKCELVVKVSWIFFNSACSGQETAVATDLLFAIDASGSLYPAGFLQEKDFIKDVIDRVGPVTSRGLRVGAVVYSDDANSTIPLNRYFTTASVKRAIDELPYDGKGTRMDLGLKKARELFSEQFGGRGSSKKVK